MASEPTVIDDTIDSNFDVIRAREQVININRNEIFENKVIDLSTGNSVFLHVTGSNSIIRNIGFKGLYRGDQFLFSINAGCGDILFENIYMGDGATKERSSFVHGPGAVFLHYDNEADVTFRRCNVQGFPNNGFYCSNTSSGSSSVHFDTCFGKNNGVATFRCAGSNDLIENCVAYTDTTDYGNGDSDYIETNGRPVWVWNGGTVTIRDSHFADGPYPHAVVAGANDAAGRAVFESGGYRGSIQCTSGSTVDVSSNVSNDPDLSIPDGVPTTAEAAASNGSSRFLRNADSDADDQLPHNIVFDGEPSNVTRYEFEIEGDVDPSTSSGATIDGETEIEEGQVSGLVADCKDIFPFDGDLEQLTVDGPATVLIDGEQIDPDDIGERN